MRSSIRSEAKKILGLIKKHDRGQILIHTSPDGDAVASAIGLFRVLRRITGRYYHLFCPKKIPERYRFLPHCQRFSTRPKITDLSIILDTADLSRLPGWKPSGLIINVDHHDSNTNFGAVNIVETRSSSTVEILMELFKYWRIGIDETTARVLYAGIFSETGGFVFRNTNAKTLSHASILADLGASPSDLGQSLMRQTTNRLHLLGLVLTGIEVDNGISIIRVTRRMFKQTKTTVDETEGFVEIPLMIPEVKISILVKELPNGKTKVSLRSKGRIDVNRIAHHFGGGGHRNAAGFIMDDTIPSVLQKIIARLRS